MNEQHNAQHALTELLAASKKIARERNLDNQLAIIASTAKALARAEAACIYLLDKTQRYLLPRVWQGELLRHPRADVCKIDLSLASKSKQIDISAHCALSGKMARVEDIYAYSGLDFSTYYHNDSLTGLHTKSILAVPLTDREGLSTGVVTLLNHSVNDEQKPDGFAIETEKLIEGFAAIAAISISNSQLINENDVLLQQQDALNRSLMVENKDLKRRIFKSLQLDEIIGRSQAMENVFGLIDKVAKSTATVFLNGETGTGKELFAATIHKNSPMRAGRFVAQNCAAFPPDLLESEMFGYRKGAFSGANENKKGLFEAAHNGTLFLDEIGEMPMSLQSKLLRVLQECEVRPLGSNDTIKVNVRIIAATNRALLDMVKEGTFREDLYYRLNVFPIQLPALRDRRSDIPALVQYFVNKFAKQYGKTIQHVAPKMMDFLQSYAFPGNVRELQNIIERAIILAGDSHLLTYDCLPNELREQSEQATLAMQVSQPENGSLKLLLAEFEAGTLKRVLETNSGNQTETAKQLGLSRRSLVEKLSKYRLRRQDL